MLLDCAQVGANNELFKVATSRHAVFDWSRIEGTWLVETDGNLQEQALTLFAGIDFQSPD